MCGCIWVLGMASRGATTHRSPLSFGINLSSSPALNNPGGNNPNNPNNPSIGRRENNGDSTPKTPIRNPNNPNIPSRHYTSSSKHNNNINNNGNRTPIGGKQVRLNSTGVKEGVGELLKRRREVLTRLVEGLFLYTFIVCFFGVLLSFIRVIQGVDSWGY